MSDLEEYEKEPQLEVEIVASAIWQFVVNWGFFIVFWYCVFLLASAIFRKLYLASLLVVWKKLLGYNRVLAEMVKLLEADHELELWSEPAFCHSYLRLYDSFGRFRAMANRDENGASIVDNRHKVDEAVHLYDFYDTDYVLRDRLVYAVEGTFWEEEGAKVGEKNEDGKRDEEEPTATAKSPDQQDDEQSQIDPQSGPPGW